ncbi:MAG: hypothetical protein GF331_23465 [Chitinivibrionales bacterium]|nr:hypothetical protein [Chitinivibrionales bacterium]
MRRAAILTSCLLITMTSTVFGQGFRFARGGLGFQVAFVVTGDTDPVDAAFNIGGMGDLAFSLGRYGEIHYKPGAGIWFGGGHDNIIVTAPDGTDVLVERDWLALEFHIDFADVAYYFPLPRNIFVRPYVGLGPMIAVDHISADHPYGGWDRTDTRLGLNLFTGTDFRINPRTYAFFEMRGRVSRWDLFKLKGGMHFVLGTR